MENVIKLMLKQLVLRILMVFNAIGLKNLLIVLLNNVIKHLLNLLI
jgi:hypothetical protein